MESRSRALWRRWVLYVTIGELLGFGAMPVLGGMLIGMATVGLDSSTRVIVLYATAVAAGLFEGATLAAFQWRVLALVVPAVSRGPWILHTAIAASLAWAAGMLAPALDDIYELSPVALVAIWVPSAIFILLSIGYAQQRLLRPHVRRSWHWLLANVAGWLLGLPWTFVLPALLPPSTPPWGFATALAIGGTLMGATVGACTGIVLLRFEADDASAAT